MAMAERPSARRPHHVAPSLDTVHVVLAVKNFSNTPGVCHVGLSVTATCTMQVLRRAGIHVDVWTCQTVRELWDRLAQQDGAARPLTHVVVSAPSWVQPADFVALCGRYPDIEFVQLNHSGTAYLSIDKYGVRNIRAVIELERALHNMRIAFNNPRGDQWAQATFQSKGLLLPNLYDIQSFTRPAPVRLRPDPLRIGSFGASRPWKNQLTAAEAALQLARRLGVDLELYINSGRPENLHGGGRMIESRRELFDGVPGARLVDVPWAQWPRFRQIVRTMDLLFSPSFDETFCVVVADGIAEGVPSVVTAAMEWTPPAWWCEPSDPNSLVTVALGLLHDAQAVHDGREALVRHVTAGIHRWRDYLSPSR
jgi:glycosyltransferase involved in cell wall biosynthesis